MLDLGFARSELGEGGGDEEEVALRADGKEVVLDVRVEEYERTGDGLGAGSGTLAESDLPEGRQRQRRREKAGKGGERTLLSSTSW